MPRGSKKGYEADLERAMAQKGGVPLHMKLKTKRKIGLDSKKRKQKRQQFRDTYLKIG